MTFGGYRTDWQPYIYALAVATMLVGSVLAVVQTDVKRMLAYSSINHAGFILVGVQAGTAEGISGALFYLAAYTFMVVGSFGVVTLVSRRGDSLTKLDDYRGLSRREPLLAFVFAIFLFAQAGVPLTSGFFAKFYVLTAAIERPLVAAGHHRHDLGRHRRVPVPADHREHVHERRGGGGGGRERPCAGKRLPIPFGAGLALAVSFAATLFIGFLPGSLADTSADAIPTVSAPAK